MSQTFSPAEQQKHRLAFIDHCRQKAWNDACQVAWISDRLDSILARYQTLQAEEKSLTDKIRELETALDYHTVENRERRKVMNERKVVIGKEMKEIIKNSQLGQQSMQQLLAGIEGSLSLALHAEKWEWQEAETAALPDAKDANKPAEVDLKNEIKKGSGKKK